MQENALVENPERALGLAIVAEAHRAAADVADEAEAARIVEGVLAELLDRYGLDEVDLRELPGEADPWIPGLVADEDVAFACAVVTEVHRRVGDAPHVGDERAALFAIIAEQGLPDDYPGDVPLVVAETIVAPVWRCQHCHRLTPVAQRPHGGRPQLSGMGRDHAFRVACRACVGIAWCRDGQHDWQAAAFDPVPESCGDHEDQ